MGIIILIKPSNSSPLWGEGGGAYHLTVKYEPSFLVRPGWRKVIGNTDVLLVYKNKS